jgi:hypothetical protein
MITNLSISSVEKFPYDVVWHTVASIAQSNDSPAIPEIIVKISDFLDKAKPDRRGGIKLYP